MRVKPDRGRPIRLRALTVRRLPAAMFLVLRRAVGSLVETAGTRDAAQVAFSFVMSFPAALLLLV
jgi:hypothetical protein